MRKGRPLLENTAKRNLRVIGATADMAEETTIGNDGIQNLLESRTASTAAQRPHDGHIMNIGAQSPQNDHRVNNDGQNSQNGRIVISVVLSTRDDHTVNNATQKQRRDLTVSNGVQSIPANRTMNLNRVITGMITEADKQFQMKNQNS